MSSLLFGIPGRRVTSSPSGTSRSGSITVDVFARNLLSPAPIVEALGWGGGDAPLIAAAFAMSSDAEVRAELLSRDLYYLEDELEYKEQFRRHFASFIEHWRSLRRCLYCGAEMHVPDAEYCIYCGVPLLVEKELGDNMTFDKVDPGPSGRLLQCLNCGNVDISSHDMYCSIYGEPVLNKCSGDADNMNQHFAQACEQSLDNRLPANARYCPYCGSKTTFLYAELLKPWDMQKSERGGNDR